MTALQEAVYGGHSTIVGLLVEAGADVNTKDKVSICIAFMYKQIII